MANKAKTKGDNEERNLVNMLRSFGFSAQRTLEKGARNDGSDTWDIDLFLDDKLPNIATLGIECKIRASGFKTIYDMKGKTDVLTIRADKKERLYIINEALFLEFIKLMKQD